MRKFVCVLLTLFAFTTGTINAQEFQNLFNGKDLSDWAGKEGFWTVQDGTIVGETTQEKPAKPNTFLVWQGGEVGDFEFKATVRFTGNNSGVQYRSELVDPENFALKGYQADLHPKPEYFGMMYGERTGRGIIAERFQRVEAGAEGKPKVVAEIGDKNQKLVDWDWNEIRIVAVGNRMVHQINGVNTIDLTDNHPEAFSKGVLGLQLHAGPPMRVEFKNLQYRPLAGDEAAAALKAAVENTKKATPSKKTAAASKSKKANQFDWVSEQPTPVWVWRTDKPTANDPIYLRQKFEVPDAIKAARLYFTCDNGATVWINGKDAGTATDWGNPIMLSDAKKFVQTGTNQIAVQAKNNGGVAAFVLKLEIETADGKKQQIISSPDWKLTDAETKDWQLASFDDSAWNLKLKKMGNFGSGPWGKPGITTRSGVDLEGLTETITIAKGFKVELLYEVPINEEGSWVSLTTDGKGRLLASDQGDKGLYRITVTEGTDEPQVGVEKMQINLSGAQGMTWHNDALYFHKSGGNLFKVTDTNGDDQLDLAEVLPSERSGGEHGNHAVIVAEDGKHLYVIGGNHAELPPKDSIVRSHVPTWDEDLLLPREWDANGHARGRLAPGGWISKFSPETKQHEIISTGYRNQYDIALNRFGDLFTYDADMEWDLGTPWYRPTRINCAVSGSDYGWRSGSGKWPEYFEDSLPAVVNIGPGCPTGVISGQGAKFPTKYQDAIFALDWTFGTIYAIHLTPDGAGYRGEQEAFCYGSPLPLTDAIIGNDGAMYFTIGGRGTQSALFRITYVGEESTKPVTGEIAGTEARKLRRSLEAFHGRQDPAAVDAAWPHLSSSDRWLRHAARVAIESQPVDQWAKKVFSEKNPQARISGAVALARMGNESHRDAQIAALLELNPAELNEAQFLGLLRAYALTFIRLGKPTAVQREQIIAALDPYLPNKSKNINTELVRVLVYLEAPNVISKAIDLIAHRGEPEVPDWTELASRNKNYGSRVLEMLANHPPTHEINYAFMLRNLRKGWTMDQRRAYIEFINSAAKYPGGNSYGKFLSNLRDEVLGYLSNADRAALADISGENFNPVPNFEITAPQGPGRTWTIGDASRHTAGNELRAASFESGRNLFHAMRCAACHRFDGLGGDVGPDLTTVKNKFDARYILESIIEPSKVISDQYQSSMVVTDDGRTLTGLVSKDGDKIIVYPADAKAKPIMLSAEQVEEILPSPVSQMPQSMLNALNGDEVRDLMAYLLSGGDPKSRIYQK
ncbi:family 16 glycoside hydrolase [uncultured Gimesia sp.]|uniref:family 16 glycoside hydrolase n=1 Tax=uncultured Gimesia sp. TaxID=1678688 RepID=UPI00262E9D49|nr:family 16 glycoside hydrolase [uncultured Gimesia sp.]